MRTEMSTGEKRQKQDSKERMDEAGWSEERGTEREGRQSEAGMRKRPEERQRGTKGKEDKEKTEGGDGRRIESEDKHEKEEKSEGIENGKGGPMHAPQTYPALGIRRSKSEVRERHARPAH